MAGEIVAKGTPQEILDDPNSLTGQYLTGAMSVAGAGEAPQGAEGPRAEDRRARAATI